MLCKTTRQLFRGKYQYKAVLTCAGAGTFRNGDLDSIYETLVKVKPTLVTPAAKTSYAWANKIKTQEDLDYCFKLHNTLSKMFDFEIRVESPWITIYTNAKTDVDRLVALDEEKVKYISVPPTNATLEAGTVIMTNTNFDYKVTMGKTTQEHSAFVEWAEKHPKVKLTKSCKKDLQKPRTWGGTHFFISGENNLLMAKMHLGGSISKIERIVKSTT